MDIFADQIVEDCPDELPVPKRSTYEGVVFRSRRRRRKDRLWRQVAGPTRPLSEEIERENVVVGVAHLCFSEDGSWFQGNMVCPQDCIYKVMGRRSGRVRTYSVSPTVSHPTNIRSVERKLTSYTGNKKEFPRCFSYSEASILSTSSSNSFDDDFDNMDDDLLDEEEAEECEKFSSCAYYNLNVLDFETGLNYSLDRVLVRRGESDCWMSDGVSKQIRFEASQSFFGTSADLFVNSQLGPSFVELGLRVYKGELRFAYKDPVCFPVTVEASQWCL